MEDELLEQQKNNAEHLKPYQFKKGQSGNPKGRPPGPSLKEWAKKYLASLNEDERMDFMEGIDKKVIWEMAEGKPDAKSTVEANLKVNSLKELSDEELLNIVTGSTEGTS